MTAEDLEKVVDYDEPAFMRRRRAAAGGNLNAALDHFGHGVVDETDLDIPTFLRRKAD